MTFFGRMNNAKGKHPTPGQFSFASYLATIFQSGYFLDMGKYVCNAAILYLYPCCDGVKPAYS